MYRFANYYMSQRMTKPTKWHMRPAKTLISLGIRPIWSEYTLCAQWAVKDPNFLHADSKDSNQTWWMHSLIWVLAGRTYHFDRFAMRWSILLFVYFRFTWAQSMALTVCRGQQSMAYHLITWQSRASNSDSHSIWCVHSTSIESTVGTDTKRMVFRPMRNSNHLQSLSVMTCQTKFWSELSLFVTIFQGSMSVEWNLWMVPVRMQLMLLY